LQNQKFRKGIGIWARNLIITYFRKKEKKCLKLSEKETSDHTNISERESTKSQTTEDAL
jgi:hypothetical protein